MNKINLLVLGAGGNVSIGILRAVRNSDINARIFGACVTNRAAGYAFCDETLISPFAEDKHFVPWLNRVINEHSIDAVISGVEEINSVLALSKKAHDGCALLVANSNYLHVFNDKLKTVNWLADNNIYHPKTLDLSEQLRFGDVENFLKTPFIVKPKLGKGSVGVFKIENEKQYSQIFDKELFIAQELIGDEDSEYTCGVYKSTFGYIEIIVMRRKLRYGSTYIAEVVDNPIIYDYCKKIACAIDFDGPFNIQLRYCHELHRPVCFEINMRLSGTTCIRHGFGFKDCQVWIKENLFNDNFKDDFNVKPGIAVRFESEVFLEKESTRTLIY